MYIRTLLVFLLALPLSGVYFACAPPDVEVQKGTNEYFSIEGFLNEKTEHLMEDSGIVIHKEIKLDSGTESKKQSTKELKPAMDQLFRNDLTRPAYAGLYDIQKINHSRGAKNDLYETRYLLKENESAPVRFLSVFHTNDNNNNDSVKAIISFRETTTYLYHSYQISTLLFNQNQLQNIHINNYQRILFFDPSRFEVSIEIEG